jgi:hypothetical protein
MKLEEEAEGVVMHFLSFFFCQPQLQKLIRWAERVCTRRLSARQCTPLGALLQKEEKLRFDDFITVFKLFLFFARDGQK